MSTALDQVRDKIHTVEVALQDSGSPSLCVSTRVEDASIQLAHRAIIDCLKSIAEALEQIERRSSHEESIR
jgi:hypothetical protein